MSSDPSKNGAASKTENPEENTFTVTFRGGPIGLEFASCFPMEGEAQIGFFVVMRPTGQAYTQGLATGDVLLSLGGVAISSGLSVDELQVMVNEKRSSEGEVAMEFTRAMAVRFTDVPEPATVSDTGAVIQEEPPDLRMAWWQCIGSKSSWGGERDVGTIEYDEVTKRALITPAQSISDYEKAGWLKKAGERISWNIKWRYVILKAPHLYWFRREDDTFPSGVISTAKLCSAELVSRKAGEGRRVLRLRSEGVPCHDFVDFTCSSGVEAEAWLQCFLKAAEAAPRVIVPLLPHLPRYAAAHSIPHKGVVEG